MARNRHHKSSADEYDMHEKYDIQNLKTNIKDYNNGKISVTSDPNGEGYAKAHRISGGDRIELFAIRKGGDGKTRFWMFMEPEEAREYAEHILQEVERAEASDE